MRHKKLLFCENLTGEGIIEQSNKIKHATREVFATQIFLVGRNAEGKSVFDVMFYYWQEDTIIQ